MCPELFEPTDPLKTTIAMQTEQTGARLDAASGHQGLLADHVKAGLAGYRIAQGKDRKAFDVHGKFLRPDSRQLARNSSNR